MSFTFRMEPPSKEENPPSQAPPIGLFGNLSLDNRPPQNIKEAGGKTAQRSDQRNDLFTFSSPGIGTDPGGLSPSSQQCATTPRESSPGLTSDQSGNGKKAHLKQTYSSAPSTPERANESYPFTFRELDRVPQSNSASSSSIRSPPTFNFSPSPPPLFTFGPSSSPSQSLFTSSPPTQPLTQKIPPTPPPPISFTHAQAPLFEPDPSSSSNKALAQLTDATQELSLASPYDDRNEPAPSHGFFTTAFQDALRDGPKIAKDAADAIKRLNAGSSPQASIQELNKLLADANDLTNFQRTDTRTVAVLGDSGEGKSSLINSLLHFPGVAQTGDLGSACTSTVTEYRLPLPQHRAPITIEVEYLSSSEIKEFISELLWSYRQLFLPGVESDETPEQEYAKYMRESEQAWSALQAAFRHKREFTEQYAQDMSEGALDRITEQLVEWTNHLDWPTGGDSGFWTATADTAEECVNHTRLFMEDRYWPFTKIIRVYLDSHVLKNGLVLADLPGLHDTNLARVRATQDYLIKCDNIIIVAKISRAITDQSLKSSLFYALSRHVPTEWEQTGAQKFKIAIVCTKSEDINPRTARIEFCGVNNRISDETMSQLDDEIKAAKNTKDRLRKKAAKKKQELLLVQARNDHVKESLQKVYSSEIGGKSLDIFCVSNKWYEKYCSKGNAEFVWASGIPDLRRFCHSITAESQMSEAKHFLTSRLSALLNSLDLWASSSLRDQGETLSLDRSVFDDLSRAINEVPKQVEKFKTEFDTCFQEQIMSFFARRDHVWDQSAISEGNKWTTWHWTQYNSWCLHNGNHETLKRGHENWNAKIIWKMRMELEGQWDLVEEEVSDVTSALLDDTSKRLTAFKRRIQETIPAQHARSLTRGIESQTKNFEYMIERLKTKFLNEVRVIRRYASESNYTSYILKDMVPIYRNAASQSGTGKAARQRSIVQGHLEGATVFPQLAIALSNNMNTLISKITNDLTITLKAVWSNIKRDVDMVFQSQQDTDMRQQTLNASRKKEVEVFAASIKAMKERHEDLLGSIESL